MKRLCLLCIALLAILTACGAPPLSPTPEVTLPPGVTATPTPVGQTPSPTPTGGAITPTPGGQVTPTPGGQVTPTPGGQITPTPGGQVTPTPTPPAQGAQVPLSDFEAEVVRLTNIERQKAGLPALRSSAKLSDIARKKSQDFITKGYFDHDSPTYGSPFDMMEQFGVTYRTAGENIAKGQRTPQEVVTGWMNSPGHRANILNSAFDTIGVGFYQNGWTQMFVGGSNL